MSDISELPAEKKNKGGRPRKLYLDITDEKERQRKINEDKRNKLKGKLPKKDSYDELEVKYNNLFNNYNELEAKYNDDVNNLNNDLKIKDEHIVKLTHYIKDKEEDVNKLYNDLKLKEEEVNKLSNDVRDQQQTIINFRRDYQEMNKIIKNGEQYCIKLEDELKQSKEINKILGDILLMVKSTSTSTSENTKILEGSRLKLDEYYRDIKDIKEQLTRLNTNNVRLDTPPSNTSSTINKSNHALPFTFVPTSPPRATLPCPQPKLAR